MRQVLHLQGMLNTAHEKNARLTGENARLTAEQTPRKVPKLEAAKEPTCMVACLLTIPPGFPLKEQCWPGLVGASSLVWKIKNPPWAVSEHRSSSYGKKTSTFLVDKDFVADIELVRGAELSGKIWRSLVSAGGNTLRGYVCTSTGATEGLNTTFIPGAEADVHTPSGHMSLNSFAEDNVFGRAMHKLQGSAKDHLGGKLSIFQVFAAHMNQDADIFTKIVQYATRSMMLGFYGEFLKRDQSGGSDTSTLIQGFRSSKTGDVTGVGTPVTPQLLKSLSVDYQPPRKM